MEAYIEGARSSTADAFLTLPLLIIGFVFFLGALTSNVGLLLLFFGQLIVSPALSFLANEPGPAWFADGKFSAMKLAKWLFSALVVLGVQAKSLGGGAYYGLLSLFIVPFVGQFIAHQYEKDVPVFFFFNPAAWFLPTPRPNPAAAATCAMIPNVDEKESIYLAPSNWLTQLTFFMGFVAANAIAIFRQPAPTVVDPDVKEQVRRQAESDSRVAARQMTVGGILGSLTISYVVLLLFRYFKTPCEANLFYSGIPLVLIGLTGAAWFQFTYLSCGIRPTDILGIVQGMVNPDMIDNPIICVGAAN